MCHVISLEYFNLSTFDRVYEYNRVWMHILILLQICLLHIEYIMTYIMSCIPLYEFYTYTPIISFVAINNKR